MNPESRQSPVPSSPSELQQARSALATQWIEAFNEAANATGADSVIDAFDADGLSEVAQTMMLWSLQEVEPHALRAWHAGNRGEAMALVAAEGRESVRRMIDLAARIVGQQGDWATIVLSPEPGSLTVSVQPHRELSHA